MARIRPCTSVHLMDSFVIGRLDSIAKTYDAINGQLNDPSVQNDRTLMVSLSKEIAALSSTIDSYDKWKRLNAESLSSREELTTVEDPEIQDMLKLELKRIDNEMSDLETALKVKALPKDKSDERNIMLEIRAGTGGDEAAIFAGELVNIYKKYCESLKWSVSCVSESLSEGVSGVRSCVLQVTGSNVYSKMKFEVRRQVIIDYFYYCDCFCSAVRSASCAASSPDRESGQSAHLHCQCGCDA